MSSLSLKMRMGKFFDDYLDHWNELLKWVQDAAEANKVAYEPVSNDAGLVREGSVRERSPNRGISKRHGVSNKPIASKKKTKRYNPIYGKLNSRLNRRLNYAAGSETRKKRPKKKQKKKTTRRKNLNKRKKIIKK